MLNFIATDLPVYKIFIVVQVSLLGHSVVMKQIKIKQIC